MLKLIHSSAPQLFMAMLYLLLTFSPSLIAQDEVGSSDATQTVERYLEMLSDSRFQQRELATKKLVEIGEPAVPFIVATATESEDREVITRAFFVLGALADGPSLDSISTAIQPMLDDEDTFRPIVRRLAHQVAKSIEDGVTQRLKLLGAKVMLDRQQFVVRIDLDEDWRGRPQDLRHLGQLRHVAIIDCEKSTISDDTVPYLSVVPKLNKLYLGNCFVKGGGLQSLESHREIRYLSLINQSLDDAAYDSLAKMHALTHLGLDETNTNDAQLARLRGLTKLETLWLTNSNVTDEGLATVASFENLTRIVLAGTSVKGPGLKHIRLPDISSIDLTNSQVDDKGLTELAGMPKLNRLRVTGTKVTEESLETILSLKKLTRLYIDRDVLSPESVATLKERLPKCRLELPKITKDNEGSQRTR